MSAWDKPNIESPEHPLHKEYKDLMMRGCPNCGSKLKKRDSFGIGNAMCWDVRNCMSEFSFDVATKDWIFNGRNERYLPFDKTTQGKAEIEALRKKKLEAGKI